MWPMRIITFKESNISGYQVCFFRYKYTSRQTVTFILGLIKKRSQLLGLSYRVDCERVRVIILRLFK